MKLVIDPPYDIGCPHILRNDEGQTAIISWQTAWVLNAGVGIPFSSEGGKPVHFTKAMRDKLLQYNFKASAKVRRMLDLY